MEKSSKQLHTSSAICDLHFEDNCKFVTNKGRHYIKRDSLPTLNLPDCVKLADGTLACKVSDLPQRRKRSFKNSQTSNGISCVVVKGGSNGRSTNTGIKAVSCLLNNNGLLAAKQMHGKNHFYNVKGNAHF